VLGVGGMGVVVAAMHLQLDQKVAIKLLLPDSAKSPEIVARFAREARAAAKIQGEHVARVIDVGELENGSPYMVMEYLVGKDLSETLRDRGQLPIAEAIDYVLQATEAIAEAHAAGIVHRDLKPANLFLTRRPDGNSIVKVLDFGISKAAVQANSDGDMSLTKTASVMGSPLYMSPEQMRSTRNVDARADIWALGVILYELLAGRVPFEASSMPELCALILTEAPQPVSFFRKETPQALEIAISRCLEKDPNRRFSNVSQLAHAIVPFGSRIGETSALRISRILGAAGMTLSPPPEGRLPEGPPGASTARSWTETGQTTRSGKSTTWIVAGGAVVAIVGVVGALVFLRGSGHTSAAAETTALVAPNAPIVTPSTAPLPSPAPTEPAPTATASTEVPKIAPAPESSASSALPKPLPVSARPREAPPAARPAREPTLAPAPAPPPAKKNPLNIDLK